MYGIKWNSFYTSSNFRNITTEIFVVSDKRNLFNIHHKDLYSDAFSEYKNMDKGFIKPSKNFTFKSGCYKD